MNANRYDKRITVTKEGRVEPWGSAPRIIFPPAPMRPPKIAKMPARAAIEAPKNPDKYVRRVIGIVGRSADAHQAGLAVYNKYGQRSVLMERPLGSWTPTRSSDGSRIDGNVKVQLVGEGKNGKLGNRDAQDLARDVAAFHAMYGGTIAKVGLVSCNSNDCDATGRSLVDKVSTELRALGIDTNVVGRNGAVRVDRNGRKHAVPNGTPGSLGAHEVDLSSGALPEAMAPSLTSYERALLGNLHKLDDSYFLGENQEQLTRFLFRGDARLPEDIYLNGLGAWDRFPGANTDLAEHQKGGVATNFVSFSKVPRVGVEFANTLGLFTGRFLYVAHGQTGRDVNKLVPRSRFPKQYEIAVPDGVAPELIVGAFDVDRKGIVAGSFQPNPRFERSMDRAGLAERQRSLLNRHAALSSALDEAQRLSLWQLEAQLLDEREILERDLESELGDLYREQETAARRDANRHPIKDMTLNE